MLLRITPFLLVTALCLSQFTGCGSNSESEDSTADSKSGQETASDDSGNSKTPETKSPAKKEFKAFSFGGQQQPTGGTTSAAAKEAQTQDVIDALKPLQIMLGTWRGTTRNVYDGFKAVDELNWVFDFRTDRNQPALVMKSDKSPYFREVRLTYLTDREIYQLTGEDKDGNDRTLEGTFTEEVTEEPGGADGKLQRKYKLQLSELEGENKERWQLVFNQQENNRYLMVLSRLRGSQKAFRLYDTVSTQREGTSFALSDTDYGEKECIVSQGLGTIAVSHGGKTYWVCCTGCKAAFEDDPEHWLAKLEERMAEEEAN